MSATALGMNLRPEQEVTARQQSSTAPRGAFGALLQALPAPESMAATAPECQTDGDGNEHQAPDSRSQLESELLASLLVTPAASASTTRPANPDADTVMTSVVATTLVSSTIAQNTMAPTPTDTAIASPSSITPTELGEWLAQHAAPPAQTLSVTLTPAELGTVAVTLRWQQGALHVHLACATYAAHVALQKNHQELTHSLAAAGYRVAELRIVHQPGLGTQSTSADVDDDSAENPTATSSRMATRRGSRVNRVV